MIGFGIPIVTPRTRRILQALMYETIAIAVVGPLLGLVFFFFYAIVFTWCFDRVFGLPISASGD